MDERDHDPDERDGAADEARSFTTHAIIAVAHAGGIVLLLGLNLLFKLL